jgi:hypothetical protein
MPNYDKGQLGQEAKNYIKRLMVLTEDEKEYMKLCVTGIYKMDLLFDNADIIEKLQNHPMILWKSETLTKESKGQA